MRNLRMIIPMALIAIPTAVSAETWTAWVFLDEERSTSESNCLQVYYPYAFDLTDNTFTATNPLGKIFSITVPPDGAIRKAYTHFEGSQLAKLEMTGNVKSRELDILDTEKRCYYKVTPDSWDED